MPRRIRSIPESDTLVEVTCRVIHGRGLLGPDKTMNEMIVGALSRAKRRYGVRVCAVVYLSNHCHLLLAVDDALQLSRFMTYVNSKIAREVARSTGWREKVWGRRYTAILVSQERAAQLARLRYLLSHGVKEGLVARCRDWPGVHAGPALATGKSLVGYWSDRSAEYRQRSCAQQRPVGTHREREELAFDPLPCLVGLSARAYRAVVSEMIAEIERASTKGSKRNARWQFHEPQMTMIRQSPAPLVHAVRRSIRRRIVTAYRLFLLAYREASTALQNGVGDVQFPCGCFPPALPFTQTAS